MHVNGVNRRGEDRIDESAADSQAD